jgi:2-phospho-L-lactate transferase/gluconeogenesis factor (CofD/UPF0052 family)
MRGETHGLDAADHVAALMEHGADGALDVALVHDASLSADGACENGTVEPVRADEAVRGRIEELGVRVVAGDLADREDPVRHSHAALRRLLEEVVS